MSRTKQFAQNTVGRDFVVGDIHGCFTKVTEKLGELNFDPDVDLLFSVGDLVDRGPESLESKYWLREPWFHAVRGNHEQMIIDAFRINTDDRVHLSFTNGGAWFFGLLIEDQIKYVQEFEKLPYLIEVETAQGLVGIVHAEVSNNDWNFTRNFVDMNERTTLEKCLWSRMRIKSNETKPIVGLHKLYVGHTPMKEVTELGNVVYTDTGAVYTEGHLTILQIN
jgi:serine/threonine protein phosphatase 1